jgi:hypothetical protein
MRGALADEPEDRPAPAIGNNVRITQPAQPASS